MKTTLELPDELLKEIKLLALHEGQELKDAVANLLRQGLDANSVGGTLAKADKAMLKRRRTLTQKFVAGEWSVELAGYEEAQEADRRSAAKRAGDWRV